MIKIIFWPGPWLYRGICRAYMFVFFFSLFALNVFIIVFFFFFNFIRGIDIIISLLVAYIWICIGLTSNRLPNTFCLCTVTNLFDNLHRHQAAYSGFTMGNPHGFFGCIPCWCSRSSPLPPPQLPGLGQISGAHPRGVGAARLSHR